MSINEWSPENPNSGHGHVHKRPDRVVARCGGPTICSICKSEEEAANDFGPYRHEFPEQEWLLHHFNIYDGEELKDDDSRYVYDGPNGNYSGWLKTEVRHDRRFVAITLWEHMECKGGWGPNENLEVHERVSQGGDWRRLTTQEICKLAEEHKPLTYWWEKE